MTEFTLLDSDENITSRSWNQLQGFAENKTKQNIYLWANGNSSGKRSDKPNESEAGDIVTEKMTMWQTTLQVSTTMFRQWCCGVLVL